MNFKSTYLEEFTFYLFNTLQEHLNYAELVFYKFSAYFDMPFNFALTYRIAIGRDQKHS